MSTSKAKSIFELAERYLDIADFCFHESRLKRLVLQGIVNATFAQELYLKCLITLDGNQPGRTHELDKLFDQLSDIDKQAIEDRYRFIVENDEVVKVLEEATGGISITARERLTESKSAFQQFRYSYEGDKRSIYTIGEVTHATQHITINKQPSWGKKRGPYKDIADAE